MPYGHIALHHITLHHIALHHITLQLTVCTSHELHDVALHDIYISISTTLCLQLAKACPYHLTTEANERQATRGREHMRSLTSMRDWGALPSQRERVAWHTILLHC